MKTFYQAIYEWVADNFGQSEADDPSWSIKALANHLSETNIKPSELNANTKSTVYSELKERSLEEDIKQVAEQKGLTLTRDEVTYVKGAYYHMDDETWEQLSVIIDNMAE